VEAAEAVSDIGELIEKRKIENFRFCGLALTSFLFSQISKIPLISFFTFTVLNNLKLSFLSVILEFISPSVNSWIPGLTRASWNV
jgi:hypothetical protein